MKLILTLLNICLIASTSIYAQSFQVPVNYKFAKAADYAPYEKDVVKCVDWIMATAVDQEINKRQEANKFLIEWLSGSPTVHVEIKEEIVTFMKSSPELLMIFMGGWAKYSIEKQDPKNKLAGTTAGLEAVMSFYTANKSALGKDKNIEKYLAMKSKGTLQAYIQKNI